MSEQPQVSWQVLLAMSIIAVIACFGAFAFTFDKINVKSKWQCALAHGTTGSLLLVIGISLIFVHSLLQAEVGSFWLMDATFSLAYVACVGL